MKTAKSFYEKYLGKAINYDNAYGVQCVDGARLWQDYFLGASIPCAGNYASGYWAGNRAWFKSKGCTEVTNYKNLRNGDLVIWNYGSKSHPSSHVAMYYEGKEFGQNQGGDRSFCLKSTNFSDMAGAFRSSNCDAGTTSTTKTTSSSGTTYWNLSSKFKNGKKFVTKCALNMRSKPSTSASVVTCLPKNHAIYYYGRGAKVNNVCWYLCHDYSTGKEGYVYGGVYNSGVAPYLKNANP